MKPSINLEKATLPQQIAWVLFCGTCLELIVLNPYAKVITGVKADVFAGSLCAFTLAVCVLVAGKSPIRVTLPEVCISLALIALAIASGLASSTPWSSSVLVFVLAATSLGGFWCARVVLNSRSRQRTFVWLCAAGLGLIGVFGLLGFYFHGQVTYFTVDTHLLTDLIFLLSFGPLALLTWRRPGVTAVGILLLALAYVVLYITGITAVDTAVLVPTVVLVLALLIVPVRSVTKLVLAVILLIVVAITVHYVSNFSPKQHFERDYNALRLEYYPFSWHVVKKAPFLGIGIRTPRENFLSDYEVWHPHYTKARFSEEVARLKVCQNMFLTLMVGMGLPFLILYSFVLSVLLFRLVRGAIRPAPDAVIPPVALLIPLAGSLFHLMVMDLLLMPYVAWFFHILLGLIPNPQDEAVPSESVPIVSAASILRSVPIAVGVAVVGIFLGTHPAFDPRKLPSREALVNYVKTMPLIAPFFAEPTVSSVANPTAPGSLVVNVRGFQGTPSKWAVMCILDNSRSMSKAEETWHPNRLRVAEDLVHFLANSLQPGSKIGVRSFLEEGPLRRKQSELPLRVSRVLCDWTSTPAKQLEFLAGENLPTGENNLCAAAEISLQKDFQTDRGTAVPRTLLITDGGKDCSAEDLLVLFQRKGHGANVPVLDVAAVGMKEMTAQSYSQTLRETGGVFLRIDAPDDVRRVVSDYVDVLARPAPTPVVVSGQDKEHRLLPGEMISLSPGSYSVTLPEAAGLDTSARHIPNVMVKSGKATVLNLVITDGKPIPEK